MDLRPIKTLIVDDEPVARKLLREELEIQPEIAVVGEAENGRDALEKTGTLKPDLVFLDLEMPIMSGFEVVRGLTETLPIIIIVTAFDQQAILAFEAGAIDYLLKPVSETRLRKAVERAKPMLNRPIASSSASQPAPSRSRCPRRIGRLALAIVAQSVRTKNSR
jgi:two-component system LytT family response regulator